MSAATPPPVIHPTSLVHEKSRLGLGVEIGPFCIIGPEVTIGEGTVLLSSVTITNRTTLGRGCIVHPNAVLGGPPQDKKYAGERAGLIIGNNVTIREGTTINIGSAGGGMCTRIGNRVLIMANAHIAHDCQVEDDVTIVNGVGLAGHVQVGRGATVGGLAGVHQWCRIGKMAFVGGGSFVTKDVLPFTTVQGDRARVIGINETGLERAGWTNERISKLRAALRVFAGSGLVFEHQDADISEWMDFAGTSKRGICLPKDRLETKL